MWLVLHNSEAGRQNGIFHFYRRGVHSRYINVSLEAEVITRGGKRLQIPRDQSHLCRTRGAANSFGRMQWIGGMMSPYHLYQMKVVHNDVTHALSLL